MSMARLTRKALAACAALIAALSVPAAAQNATFLDAPSPEKIAVSAGGVDVRTGRHTYSATDVAVGEGPGALSLERTMPTPMQGHVAPFGNFSHNWDIVLVIKPVPLDQYPGNYDYLANVSYGGRSQTFEKLHLEGSSQFVQKSQNDFTRLTTTGTVGANNIVYTYQATDGTIAVFRPIGGNYPNGYWRSVKGGNAIDPSTGKPPPGNLSASEQAARTHVPLPENSAWNPQPTANSPSMTWPQIIRTPPIVLLACFAVGGCWAAEAR